MASTQTRERTRRAPFETRTAIIDAADKALRERPFREVSVDGIMRETGYGRTVFYRHFSGMPDLILAVVSRIIPEFVGANEALIEAADSAIDADAARAILRPAVVHWRRHGPLLQALRDASVYEPEIEVIARESLTRLRRMTLTALKRRRAAGYLQAADLPQLATALAALTQRYLVETYGTPGSRVPVDVATDTLALIWRSTLDAK